MGHNQGVTPPRPTGIGLLAEDTSVEIERRQVAAWRRMTPAEKLELVGHLRQTAWDLALIGMRRRYPAAAERECFLRLAALTWGDLARAAYPELRALEARSAAENLPL